MYLMDCALNLMSWQRFSERAYGNHQQLSRQPGNSKLGVGVKQIFQLPVGALHFLFKVHMRLAVCHIKDRLILIGNNSRHYQAFFENP